MGNDAGRSAWLRLLAVVVLGAVLLVPEVSGAAPSQSSDPAEDSNGRIPLDIDVLHASNTDLEQAITDLNANVESQLAALTDAEARVVDAQEALKQAQSVVAETQAAIDVLVGQSDVVVIEAFISPPSQSALENLTSETAVDATLKQSVLDMQADSDADILEQLNDAQDKLEDEKAAEQDAADTADAAVAEAETALAELQGGVTQQATFRLEVERRLDQMLVEMEHLKETDPERAAELEQRAAELAGQIAAVQDEAALERAGVEPPEEGAPEGPITITIEGGLANVSCPTGGQITVAGVLARDLQSLLNLASQEGLPMCGNGWRDIDKQIALRRQNCGTSDYYIYRAPSSACSPPTAPPGSSMHEQGLAIDFTCNGSSLDYGDACHDFLEVNAADFGLYQLPSESWHWSTDGT